MQHVLSDLRKINAVLQYENLWNTAEDADLPFTTLSEVLGRILKVDLFIVSTTGKILGYHDEYHLNNHRMQDYIDLRQLPTFYVHELVQIEKTQENISVASPVTIFPVELTQDYQAAQTTIIPIFASGKRLGFLIMGMADALFSDRHLILAEHAASVVGTELMHWQSKLAENEVRERNNVLQALKSLSYSELEAMKVILGLVSNLELRFTALKIAQEHHITRTVIVNAIRKLESAGILESRSLGTKGTFLKIKNFHTQEVIQEEIQKL